MKDWPPRFVQARYEEPEAHITSPNLARGSFDYQVRNLVREGFVVEGRREELARINTFLAENDDVSILRSMVEGVPQVFSSEDIYRQWRDQVVADLGIDPDGVFLVGSGSVGLSLNRNKAGRLFRRVGDSRGASDLDIAVIDQESFIVGWEETVRADQDRRLGGTPENRQSTRTGIYWGHLSGWKVPRGSDAARRVRLLITAAGRYRPLSGHRPSVRIYRRMEDLRGYQLNSLRGLRQYLLTAEGESNEG